MPHGMYDGGYMWFGWIFWLILLGVIIWAVFTIVNRNKNIGQNLPPHETPLDVLKKRYAAGEIDAQEYEERKKIIERDSPK